MQAVEIDDTDLMEMGRWFASEPNLRPPACARYRRLRQLFCSLEVRFHLDGLGEEEVARFTREGLPIGAHALLSIGEEHMLVRRMAALEALRDAEHRLPDTTSELMPEDLRQWVTSMRLLRQISPGAIAVRIVQRRFPDFPWTDRLSTRLWNIVRGRSPVVAARRLRERARAL
ncbi:MAG: hypothetical protein EOM91_10390 [Sphingobacteriia bacterium]|jgi:hypothetical protein|nr:hypothetical protein [Sphingobacteriia bacterium]